MTVQIGSLLALGFMLTIYGGLLFFSSIDQKIPLAIPLAIVIFILGVLLLSETKVLLLASAESSTIRKPEDKP